MSRVGQVLFVVKGEEHGWVRTGGDGGGLKYDDYVYKNKDCMYKIKPWVSESSRQQPGGQADRQASFKYNSY